MEVVAHVKSEPQPQSILPDLETSSVVGERRSSAGIKSHQNHPSKPRNPSSHLPSHKISTIHTISSGTSTPVRITTISGEQLHTMAKSTTGLSVVHVTVPQSVIQSPSVIQSAGGQQVQLPKNLILVQPTTKASSGVIQTTGGGAIQAVQVLEGHHSEDSLSNDGVDLPTDSRTADRRRQREILTRRPSYRKILNDLGGAEISGDKGDSATTSESSQDGSIVLQGQYPVKVINANALGLGQATSSDGASGLQTITMTNASTGGTIVQYAGSQDGQQFFVPVGSGEIQAYTIRPVSSSSSSPSVVVSGGSMGHSGGEEVTRKREIRLLKNREAARECRRKKKEYIKCLENRVAVLENQNKALIDELKSLKELYCQQKND